MVSLLLTKLKRLYHYLDCIDSSVELVSVSVVPQRYLCFDALLAVEWATVIKMRILHLLINRESTHESQVYLRMCKTSNVWVAHLVFEVKHSCFSVR